MDIRLDGRRAIVTGAASGIGAAIAQSLSESGALVLLTDRNAAGLQTVAASLAGPSAQAVIDFIDDDAGVRVVNAAVEAFGGVDIVINCAGVLETAPFGEITPSFFDRVMKINVRGAYMVTLAAFPYLSRGSAVVNIASGNAVLASPGGSAYATSKGALVSMTRGMAADFSPLGIRVNCICPGPIETPLLETALADPAMKALIVGAVPAGRMGLASEVGAVATFLASDAASFMFGASINVDGGTTAVWSPAVPGASAEE
jgi:NAD(P)-dependent dehydrogenase (short-subunit alcohol dehydrogenase family)